MSSPTTRAFSADHPTTSHHNTAKSNKTHHHRLSLSSSSSPIHLTTLTHAPSHFLTTLHHHERELAITHQQRHAKKEALAAIERYEAGVEHSSSPSSSSSSSAGLGPTRSASSSLSSADEPHTVKGSSPTAPVSKGAHRAAMGANASAEDEAEWAAILAAREAATRRSPTVDFGDSRTMGPRRSILEEMEAEERGE